MTETIGYDKVNILIVDDRPDKLLAMETALAELGENLVKVTSGADALRALLKDDYALVILDVSMPIMDGFETASLIRQRKRTEHTPIIFVTGINTTETHVSRGYELGAVDYIFTPVEPAVLRSKVSAFIDLYKKNNQLRIKSEMLRMQAEERAESLETRMHALLNRLNLGVFRLSAAARLLEANPAFLRLLGVASLDEAQQRCEKMLHDLAERHASTTEQSAGASEEHDLLLERPDGTSIWVSVSTTADGEFIDGILEDITSRRSAAEALRQNEAALKDADRRKDEFIAMLGHELRNPLNAIHSATQLLDRPGMENFRKVHTGVIGRQVKQLVRLIDDLLDVSRITRGKIQLRKEHVQLLPIIHAAVEVVRPLYEERAHNFALSVPPEAIWLDADPTRIEQILVNLLMNAGKYTPKGGQISLRAAYSGGSVAIQVQDNGVGIRPDVLPHIFDLFSQAERTLDRAQGGLGIGLTLVQKLTEMHAGKVSAASGGTGKGSTFVVTLPCVTQPEVESDRPAEENGHRRFGVLRILIVEDHLDSAELTGRYLSSRGHSVKIVSHSKEAISTAKSFKPHLILLDIGLPELNGYEVAEKIRKEKDLKDVLLIAVSGYGQDRDKKLSMLSGFDYHLVKPLNYDYLLDELLPAYEAKGRPVQKIKGSEAIPAA